MPAKSKTKGKSFEREICKYLGEKYDASFRRVFDSGAFTGGINKARRESLTEGQIRSHKGDIVPPDDWKYFNCECKFYAEFPFHQLFFDKPILLLESWTLQALDAADENDCTIVIMKINRKGRYIMVDKVEKFNYNKCIDYTDSHGRIWAFCELDAFFDANQERFKKRCLR